MSDRPLQLHRTTRSGGSLALREPYTGELGMCATCGAQSEADGQGNGTIGLLVTTPRPGALSQPIRMDTAICADCLAEALAILFGRRHLQQGGHLEDLAQDPSPVDEDPGDA